MSAPHTYTNVTLPASYENIDIDGKVKAWEEDKKLYSNFPEIEQQLLKMQVSELLDDEEEELPANYRPNPMYNRENLRKSLKQHGPEPGEDKLEFEKSHPVFEMLRLTAFLCLEESKAIAKEFIVQASTGQYLLQKSSSIPKTILLLVKTASGVETFEIRRKVSKKFKIFDQQFTTLHDLLDYFRFSGDASIPCKLTSCCTGLDKLIEKNVKKFLAQPSISMETFTLKALLLTLCNAMREKYHSAAIVPFMPHWLEYSLLPSDKDGLSLKPSVAGSAPASAPEAPPRRTSDPATRAPAPVPAPVVEAPPAAPPRRRPPAMDLKASRQDAEGRLLRCGQLGCYIIRASKTLADKMALSVLVRPGLIEHFQCSVLPDKKIQLKSGRIYQDWVDLVEVHSKESLPKVGIPLTINCCE